MATLAKIANLDELSVWTSGGSHAKARLEFTVTDADGDSISTVYLRLYSASVGGSLLATYTLNGATLATALANGYYDTAFAIVLGTEYWWTIEAIDSLGESSGESSRTGFKVRWGQAIYEYAVPGGVSSSGWSWANASLPGNTSAAILFATATGLAGAGRSAWKKSIGELTPDAYLNVMVRLTTYLAGTQPTLDDMTFSYLSSATIPDHWTSIGSLAISQDPTQYRFGTRGLRCLMNGATNGFVYPFRSVAGDDLSVVPGQEYTLSGYCRSDIATVAALRVLKGGNPDVTLADSYLVRGDVDIDPYDVGVGKITNAITDWVRIHVHFTVPSGMTTVRPMLYIQQYGAGVPHTVWTDAWRLEEGRVITQWAPSFLSPAAVSDSYGALYDALAGATLRLRSSTGVTVGLDQIVAAAAGGGGGGGSPNLDGGLYNSTYGGTTAIDGGTP
jgi:hypothetical protein